MEELITQRNHKLHSRNMGVDAEKCVYDIEICKTD